MATEDRQWQEMWWHLLLECIESDERGAGIVESSRRRLIEGRLVAVRRERDAWLVAQSGDDISSSVMREGHEAAGQRTAEDLMQLVQRQGSPGVAGVCAQQDEGAKTDWGITGHVGTLAMLGAVGVSCGRGCGGGCCADSE